MKLFDMHCHLDFLPDNKPALLAEQGVVRGIGAFSATVTPADYARAQALLGSCANVRVGVGLHPWWIETAKPTKTTEAIKTAKPAKTNQIDNSDWIDCREHFDEFIGQTRFIGEIGLDFAPRHRGTSSSQIEVLGHVLDAVQGYGGGKVLSIHAVRSADTVLDMLETRGVEKNNICILHWFSGSSDELLRALRLGCYFSVGKRMVDSKRGRAYVRRIPLEHLLLETDMPACNGASYSIDEWERDLRTTLACIAQARGQDERELGETIAHTSTRILESEEFA